MRDRQRDQPQLSFGLLGAEHRAGPGERSDRGVGEAVTPAPELAVVA